MSAAGSSSSAPPATDPTPASASAPAAPANKKEKKDKKKKDKKKKDKQSAEEPKPAVVATLVGSKRKAPEHDAVKGRLECAICMNIMFPPIRQCAEGHNFCDKCCVRLMNGGESARKCPTCRVALGSPVARARNLEQWATEADVEVTCDHEECGQSFKYSEYAEHKKTCVGCSVACPKAGCTWRGEAKDLAAHLMASSEAGGHNLRPCPTSAKYSRRHADYSTTVIFETKRKVGCKRRWRPPRQLIQVPPNPKLGTEACTFVVALWKAKGAGEPLVAAISALRKPEHDETPWSFDISLSAYPRPPHSLCVSRASACGPMGDLDAKECWSRPKVPACRAPVLVADAASMAVFNTAHLENDGGPAPNGEARTDEAQRYELHVRLMPITAELDPRNGGGEAADPAGRAYAGHGRHGHVHGDRLLLDSDNDMDYSDEGDEVDDFGEEEDDDESDDDSDSDDSLDDDDDDDDESGDESDITDDYSDLSASDEDEEEDDGDSDDGE